MPPRIQEMYDNFDNWLHKLSNSELWAMIDDLKDNKLSTKEFIARWGLLAIPFSNWKKDKVRKELEARELII